MRKVILLSMVILSAIVAPFQSMDVVAQERVVLEAPTEVSVVQTEYGASGVLRVSWSNPEMYGFVEVAVDGEVVDVALTEPGSERELPMAAARRRLAQLAAHVSAAATASGGWGRDAPPPCDRRVTAVTAMPRRRRRPQ